MSIKSRLKELGKERVTFANKMEKVFIVRNYLSKDYLKNILFDFDKQVIEYFDSDNNTYRLVYDISGRYHLVVVVTINGEIKVVTAYKTSKSIQRIINKFGGFYSVKNTVV